MGIHVDIDYKNQKANIWICLTSGCTSYEEFGDFIDVRIEDALLNGLRIEKTAVIKKRENYREFVENFLSGRYPMMQNEPIADEKELLDVYHFASERVKKGMRYVGTKIEFVSPKGIRVYFRMRLSEGDVAIELVAEKEGERITYNAAGKTADVFTALREAVHAIGAYILFSEYISRKPLE